MTLLLSIIGFLHRLPRPIGFALLAALAIAGIAAWHGQRIDAAYANGLRDQSIADRAGFASAATAAAAVQQRLVTTLAARQQAISKESEDALVATNTDLARRYAALRLRWAAADTDRGGTGAGRAIAVPDAAPGVDDTACAARGWVSFDTAAAAAEAADSAIAKDDAWIAWVRAQRAAWPNRFGVTD